MNKNWPSMRISTTTTTIMRVVKTSSCSLFLVMIVAAAAADDPAAFLFSPSSLSNPKQRVRAPCSLRQTFLSYTKKENLDSPNSGTKPVGIDQNRLEETAKKWRRKDLFGSTLIDQTVTEMKDDQEFQATAKRYKELGSQKITAEERAIRRRALTNLGIPNFPAYVRDQTGLKTLKRKEPKILQINM